MKPEGLTYRRMLMIDTTLWSPIFAQLTKLSIVAQQPLGARIHSNEPPFKREMQGWMEWLRVSLQYVVRQLPTFCVIEMDDDDEIETSTPMERCLPSGYRKAQTLVGDYCFRRKDCFMESGYWRFQLLA